MKVLLLNYDNGYYEEWEAEEKMFIRDQDGNFWCHYETDDPYNLDEEFGEGKWTIVLRHFVDEE